MSKIVTKAVVACAINISLAFSTPAVLAQANFYTVAPQSLEDALFEFAEKARLSINFSGLDIAGLKSVGTKGHISRSASLRSILSGTGIGFRFEGENSVQLFQIVERTVATPEPVAAPTVLEQSEGIIEDLVVTANKRSSTTFNLPANVSAVSSVTLEDWSSYDLQSVAPHLAGVLTTNLGPGRNKIFVRGLSDGAFTDRTQAMVGVYIDEAPINYSDTNPDIRLFDVERVELLRGPQGTLYGSGSLAGVYRVITAKPDLAETRIRTRLESGYTKDGGLNGTLDMVYNQPIVRDKLGFRLTGYVDFKSGYIDDIEMGDNDVNSLRVYGARPALRWQINDGWTLDAVANFQAIRYEDSQYYYSDLGRNKRDNELPEPYEDTFLHGNLTLRGSFSGMTLTSSTALVDRSIVKQADASDGLPFLDSVDDLSSDLFNRSDISIFSTTTEFLQLFSTDEIGYITDDDIRIFSHETRLQSEKDATVEWLIGGYYQGRRQHMGALLAFARANDPSREAHLGLAEDRLESSDEFALFGEATYGLTDKLSITGGMRYSRSLLKLDYTSLLALNDDAITQKSRKIKQSFIPKFAMRYEWTDEIQTYAVASVGYRIGGLNINTPTAALVAADPDHEFEDGFNQGFQSDNLFNGEIGLKSYWFDRKLGLNFSAFMVDWYDIQSDQIGPSGLPLTVNVGEARIYGYELEFNARPARGLEIHGSLFFNDSEMQDDNPFLGVKAGDRLPAIPENTASFSLLYEIVLGREWLATIQTDYSFIGKSVLNFDEDSSAAMGKYGILNAKLQFHKDNWKFGLFARNLTDTKANTFSYGNGFRLFEKNQVTPPRPLTAGIFLETSF